MGAEAMTEYTVWNPPPPSNEPIKRPWRHEGERRRWAIFWGKAAVSEMFRAIPDTDSLVLRRTQVARICKRTPEPLPQSVYDELDDLTDRLLVLTDSLESAIEWGQFHRDGQEESLKADLERYGMRP